MDEVKRAKFAIWKNILLISLSFLMVFNAFQGLSRLQSSLHRVEGMGTISQAVLYASLMLSCMFVPKLLIILIGHKWTIPLSFIGYILYMAANGYAVWGTMITASIIVGLCAAPLWTAQCSYFTKLAVEYAKLTDSNEKEVVSRFFGIFFMFFQISGITGSIISATILKPKAVNGSMFEGLSADEAMDMCGAGFCPWKNYTNPNLEKPPEDTVWLMVGIYMGIAVVAVIMVCIFVDKLPEHLQDDRKQALKEIPQLLSATFKQLAHPAQCFLIPLTMYSGFEQAYFNAEISQAFVSCGLGIWKVGLVTLPYGCVNALVSLTSGQLVQYIGRTPIFIAAMVVDLAIQFTLMFWKVNPAQEYVFYIIAGMWGFTDGIWQTQINVFFLASMWGFTEGIWQTQINALYGAIFTKNSEAAFSNYRMWESLGYIIAFAYSQFLCTSVKTYILTAVLFAGMLGYVIVIKKYKAKKDDTEGEKPGPLATPYEQTSGFKNTDQAVEPTGYANPAFSSSNHDSTAL